MANARTPTVFPSNGASVQEGIGQQAGIIPNLDSMSEFRILTSNTDAEYGNYSGGHGFTQTTRVTESSSREFRFETFNTFNHAQFDSATSVDGNINDSTFGQILKSQPRLASCPQILVLSAARQRTD